MSNRMMLGLKNVESLKRISITRVVASKYLALGVTFADCFLVADMVYLVIQIILVNC